MVYRANTDEKLFTGVAASDGTTAADGSGIYCKVLEGSAEICGLGFDRVIKLMRKGKFHCAFRRRQFYFSLKSL